MSVGSWYHCFGGFAADMSGYEYGPSLQASFGSGSLCRNSLARVYLEAAVSFLSLGDSVAKASAVRVAGFGVSFGKRAVCDRDPFDLADETVL
jgi:hypothetical protein